MLITNLVSTSTPGVPHTPRITNEEVLPVAIHPELPSDDVRSYTEYAATGSAAVWLDTSNLPAEARKTITRGGRRGPRS